MRTFGVEEELLLVDELTGRPVAVAPAALASDRLGAPAPGPSLDAELQQEMIETATRPCETLDRLRLEILAGRARADAAARSCGARAVALAMSPEPVDPHPTASARYDEMVARYGRTARTNLTCGFHVHVAIESSDEGVAVLDRIRGWLPVLLALSANSPFESGGDTGHESFRYASWMRWPTSGPLDVLGSAAAYRELEQGLLGSGVLMDAGMFYFDARLSRRYPTVEVRVMDVCLSADAAASLAALVRGMAVRAIIDLRAGSAPLELPTPVLRLASWKAALCGATGELLDPRAGRLRPAEDVVAALLAWSAAGLDTTGDTDEVHAGVGRILRDGTGARRQRMLRPLPPGERTRALVDASHDAAIAAVGAPMVDTSQPSAYG
ncbi:glutamate--cysteine ligase [Protaetiibacter sp. SSC-01]|uniref:carboxylate-amine ligase n=1 Tax=Protaetiibacter sp. SSC-01 TaxID=2759943 RepID=UPI001656C53D|nr:glutamate--cysteine ligase [Protaetiibacter sp. SSC-01]QNO37358.1 glutamate--cysteine ligase [Protaetiibacter sp. SSC-01]